MRPRFRFAAWTSRLASDERGNIALMFMTMLPVLMGLIGLGIDASRFMMVNSELQDLADAAALAGAKELDGRIDAIDRATARAQSLLNNEVRWSNVAAAGIQIGAPVFKASLTGPALSNTPADQTAARFVVVTTINRSLAPSFLTAVGVLAPGQTHARATAGVRRIACGVTPLMLCNPYEPAGQPFHATPGQMFQFKAKSGGNSSYAPGDFGLVDPPGQDSSGANEIRNLLTQRNPGFCYVDGISPRPGQAAGMVDDGINVRFDRRPNGNTAGMDLTPAPNVIDGTAPASPSSGANLNALLAGGKGGAGAASGNAGASSANANAGSSGNVSGSGNFGNDNGQGSIDCNNFGPAAGLRLPRDASMTAYGSVNIGNGPSEADKNAYWRSHHDADWPADVPTRYAGYLRELGLNGPAPPWKSNSEASAPVCAPAAGFPAGDHTRRIVTVAVIDCIAGNVHGNAVTDLETDTYGEFFVTEPAAGGEIFTEFVQMLPASKFRSIVQLYR